MSRVLNTKEKLLAAALDLIWRNSYGATSVDHLCAAAGVVKGSFYHFFKSKSDLAIAALEAEWKHRQSVLNEMFSPLVPPLERLSRLFREGLEEQARLKEEKGCVVGCPMCSLGSEMGTQDEHIRVWIDNALQEYFKYYEAAIRDAHYLGLIHAPDPATTAKVVIQYVHGAMMEARIQNSLAPIAALEAGVKCILGVREPLAV